jgi:hypothetical protein
MNRFRVGRLSDDTIVISINDTTYIHLSDLETRDLFTRILEVLRQ